MTQSEEKIVIGVKASPENVFYRDLGEKLTAGSMDFLNQVLRQFVTISSAFCGGIIATHGKGIVSEWLSATALVAMLFSLSFSAIGILPSYSDDIELGMVTRIKSAYDKTISKKKKLLYISTSLFFTSLFMFVAGILLRIFGLLGQSQ